LQSGLLERKSQKPEICMQSSSGAIQRYKGQAACGLCVFSIRKRKTDLLSFNKYIVINIIQIFQTDFQ
jgi:hypothetical protein